MSDKLASFLETEMDWNLPGQPSGYGTLPADHLFKTCLDGLSREHWLEALGLYFKFGPGYFVTKADKRDWRLRFGPFSQGAGSVLLEPGESFSRLNQAADFVDLIFRSEQENRR